MYNFKSTLHKITQITIFAFSCSSLFPSQGFAAINVPTMPAPGENSPSSEPPTKSIEEARAEVEVASTRKHQAPSSTAIHPYNPLSRHIAPVQSIHAVPVWHQIKRSFLPEKITDPMKAMEVEIKRIQEEKRRREESLETMVVVNLASNNIQSEKNNDPMKAMEAEMMRMQEEEKRREEEQRKQQQEDMRRMEAEMKEDMRRMQEEEKRRQEEQRKQQEEDMKRMEAEMERHSEISDLLEKNRSLKFFLDNFLTHISMMDEQLERKIKEITELNALMHRLWGAIKRVPADPDVPENGRVYTKDWVENNIRIETRSFVRVADGVRNLLSGVRVYIKDQLKEVENRKKRLNELLGNNQGFSAETFREEIRIVKEEAQRRFDRVNKGKGLQLANTYGSRAKKKAGNFISIVDAAIMAHTMAKSELLKDPSAAVKRVMEILEKTRKAWLKL